MQEQLSPDCVTSSGVLLTAIKIFPDLDHKLQLSWTYCWAWVTQTGVGAVVPPPECRLEDPSNAVTLLLVPSCLHEAGQLSQSAHFSLQLPYTVLGLGRSANFLDHLYVGIPRQTGETVRKQDIIPWQSQVLTQPVDIYICANIKLGFTFRWLFHKDTPGRLSSQVCAEWNSVWHAWRRDFNVSAINQRKTQRGMASGAQLGSRNLFKQMVDLFGLMLLKAMRRGQCFLCSKDFVWNRFILLLIICMTLEAEDNCKYCLYTRLFQIVEGVIILSSTRFSANVKNGE